MADWIVGLIEQYGYLGIALLMLLENVFPPIPSELIMPFAGFAAARGDLHPAGVLAAGTAGSLLGTLPWYWAGRSIGEERLKRAAARHGRWLAMSPDDIAQAGRWFERHGPMAVFLCRLVPTLRSVISAPAGIARMPLPSFLAWTVIGTLLWTGALAGIGYALESRYEQIQAWLNPVSTAVVVIAVAAYLWRVVRWKQA